MELPTSFCCQLQVSAARVSHFFNCFWMMKLCEFLQIPSLSMGVHGTLIYLNLTFMNYKYCRTGVLILMDDK